MRMWQQLVWTVVVAIAAGLSPAVVAWEGPPVFVDLRYPAEALAARVTGTIVVRATTDPAGRVVEAEALSGPAALRPAVVANLRQWKLAPGPRTDIMVYRFEIDYGACNDDSRSLFRLMQPNFAVVTACTGPGRAYAADLEDDVRVVSFGTVPSYPQFARSTRMTGLVALELTLDATGAVTTARALNRLPGLTEVAIEHAKSWRIRTTAARRGIIVYEFALDNPVCEPAERTIFRRIGSDYVRLSACEPPLNVNAAR